MLSTRQVVKTKSFCLIVLMSLIRETTINFQIRDEVQTMDLGTQGCLVQAEDLLVRESTGQGVSSADSRDRLRILDPGSPVSTRLEAADQEWMPFLNRA